MIVKVLLSVSRGLLYSHLVISEKIQRGDVQMTASEITFGARLGAVEETVERAQFAERLGYDFISSGEHFMSGHTSPSHTILPVLAVAAGATKDIRLLSAVLFFPMYHPTMIAKLTTTLDIASGGRLTLGIGVGGEVPTDFAAMGL